MKLKIGKNALLLALLVASAAPRLALGLPAIQAVETTELQHHHRSYDILDSGNDIVDQDDVQKRDDDTFYAKTAKQIARVVPRGIPKGIIEKPGAPPPRPPTLPMTPRPRPAAGAGAGPPAHNTGIAGVSSGTRGPEDSRIPGVSSGTRGREDSGIPGVAGGDRPKPDPRPATPSVRPDTPDPNWNPIPDNDDGSSDGLDELPKKAGRETMDKCVQRINEHDGGNRLSSVCCFITQLVFLPDSRSLLWL